MNEYKITDSAGNTSVPIIAVDEKDARKIFKATCKWAVGEIADITLVRENVPATKAQEREAVERIRAIVATLGPHSYVGTALEGCLEDAEANIENDFGDSMKARWQAAERRVAEAVKETAAVKKELAQVRQALQSVESDADFLRDKVIDSDDLTDIAQLIEDKLDSIEERIKDAAERIVEVAEEPETSDFIIAVKEHRDARDSLEYYQALAKRIAHAQGK